MSQQEYCEVIERAQQWIEENKIKAKWFDAMAIYEDEYSAYLHRHLSSDIKFEDWLQLAHPEIELID